MSLDEILASTPVKAIMTAQVETVQLGTPLRQSLEQMLHANVGSLVVTTREMRPLLLRDVAGLAPVFFVLREFMAKADSPIETAMFTDFITARSDDTVAEVMGRIVNNKTWRMIVADENDYIVGLLSATDIIRLLGDSLAGRTKA